MSQVNSKTGAIDLDHQGQIGLQTSTSLKKFKNSFLYPIKLKLCIDHLLAPSRQFLGAGGGGDTCFLQIQERLYKLDFYCVLAINW